MTVSNRVINLMCFVTGIVVCTIWQSSTCILNKQFLEGIDEHMNVLKNHQLYEENSNNDDEVVNILNRNKTVEEEDKDALSSSSMSSSQLQIDYSEKVQNIIINVGSNRDPIMPNKRFGPCARSIAVEPIVPCLIQSDHQQLDILPVAIADISTGNSGGGGITSMAIYNRNGLSSSLNQPATNEFWNSNEKRGDGRKKLVPLLSMKTLLESIPKHVTIEYMMTDMQGYDFTAIRSAGETLVNRVSFIQTEVWINDKYSYDATNDLCRDWIPYMTNLGYDLYSTNCNGFYKTKKNEIINNTNNAKDIIDIKCKQQLEENPIRPNISLAIASLSDECDATWIRTKNPPIQTNDIFVKFHQAKQFTEQEYDTCL